MNNINIADRFLRAELVLKNSKSNEDIRQRLVKYGYTDEKLAEGEKLYQKAFDLYTQQKEEYGDQYQATDEKETKRKEIHKIYMQHLTLARLAFKNDDKTYGSLDLIGRRKGRFYNWLNQARLFYVNLLKNEERQTALEQFGIKKEQLEEMKKQLDELEIIYVNQQQEKGEAQEATKIRDDAFEQLDEWLSDFFTVVRLALHDKKQLLESFGVVVPSGHYEIFAEEEQVS